jgi:hypothetical protein
MGGGHYQSMLSFLPFVDEKQVVQADRKKKGRRLPIVRKIFGI